MARGMERNSHPVARDALSVGNRLDPRIRTEAFLQNFVPRPCREIMP